MGLRPVLPKHLRYKNMSNILPHKSPDRGAFTQLWNKLLDYIKAGTLFSSSDILVNRTPNGTTLTLATAIKPTPTPSVKTTGSSVAAQCFYIAALSNGNSITAVPFSASAGMSASYVIAKSPRLRTSISSEVIDGITINYSSYTSDNSRTANDGTNVETQVAFPRYVTGSSASVSSSAGTDMSIVYAVPCVSTGVASASWIEILPARVWSSVYPN